MATETETADPMHAEPQEEHNWLQKFVGDWTYEAESQEPGQPSQKSTGTETVRSLGGLWTVGEGQGEMPGGGAATMIMTLGYDPRRQRFVGTWIGSMMAHLWVYEGRLDRATSTLTLESDGPGMAGDGTLARYRDVIEFRGNDHRVLTSHVLSDDGEWHRFMTADYRRKK
jgi:hypothetical protein